jgi:carbonic anhydrase
MKRLVEGYRRFRAGTWPIERARYQALSLAGQRPETLVIACSDSRVDPATVFGAGPGELFVVRNVAGLVPPYQPDAGYHGTSAAVEYGVRVLKVNQIVVLGHAQCGGVQAMINGAPVENLDFVRSWIAIAAPIMKPVPPGLTPDELQTHYETQVVRLSLANLRTFPWIVEAEAAGTLSLHGARFGIETGRLMELQGDEFVPVA